jgi:hypothetical protein
MISIRYTCHFIFFTVLFVFHCPQLKVEVKMSLSPNRVMILVWRVRCSEYGWFMGWFCSCSVLIWLSLFNTLLSLWNPGEENVCFAFIVVFTIGCGAQPKRGMVLNQNGVYVTAHHCFYIFWSKAGIYYSVFLSVLSSPSCERDPQHSLHEFFFSLLSSLLTL